MNVQFDSLSSPAHENTTMQLRTRKYLHTDILTTRRSSNCKRLVFLFQKRLLQITWTE